MAYPQDYDELTGLDLGECAIFAHVLTDGIVDTADEMELDNHYCVYAHYGSGTPVLDVIDPKNDELLSSGIEAEWLENAALYKFCVDVPAEGSDGEGDTKWLEKGVILKVHSDDSPLLFKKHVLIIKKACAPADMCETMDRAIESLERIEDTDVKQDKVLKTLSNGWKIIS